MKANNWTRNELILAFNLYCKVPFSKINANYPPVKELSAIIGRSNNAVAMKLANFARLDPELQARGIKGLKGGGKGEQPIWDEFNHNWDALAYQSELLLASYIGKSIEEITAIDTFDLPEGKEREAIVKIRVNQSFFRKSVLASYDNRCCITGINIPALLVAGHIIPWSTDKLNRVNPSNGLCLNALHDKAFDQGLITITPDFIIQLSNELLVNIGKTGTEDYFAPFEQKKIVLPQKFLPNREFLEYHNTVVFKK
jgi:putative restriction endonuclease